MKKLRLATLYSQRDDRWKNLMLGNNPNGTPYTIGNYGCLITAVDVYLNALGINIDVAALNDKLKQNGGFGDPALKTGLYVFDALKNIYPDIKADYISPKWNGPVPDADIQKMKDLIDQGKYLITEVDFYPNTVNEDMHWVGVYGYDDQGNFLIFDPWTGTLVPLSVYGDPKRVIYCYRTYTRPLNFDSVENVVCHPVSKNDELIHNSTAWGETVTYLEIGTDPKETSSDTVKAVIGGFKSRSTDLQKQVDTANAQVTNLTEQTSRLKDQVLEDEKLRKGLQDQINSMSKNQGAIAGVYEGKIKAQQETIDEFAKAKGALVIENTQLKTQVDKLKADAAKALSASDLIRQAITKLSPFIDEILKALQKGKK